MDFSNLGVALGAGVDEYNNQRRMAREDAREKRDAEQFGMQKEQFGWQRDDQKRKSEIQQRQDALMRAAQANAGFLQELDSLPDDKLGEFTGRVLQHYNQDPAWANGMYANLTNVEGKPYVVHGNMAKLGGVQMIPVTRDGIRGALGQMNDDLRRRLALTSPEGYAAYADKQDELGIKRDANAIEREYKGRNGVMDRRYGESNELGWFNARNSDKYHMGELDLRRLQLQQQAAQHAEAQRMGRMGQPVTMYEGDTPVLVTPVMNRDGSVSHVKSPFNGLQYTPKSSGAKGGGAMPQMTVADYAKLEELADARASLLARDPANKNQKPTFLRDVAKEQILSEMGYGTSVKGVQGRGAPGALGNPYAANATARGASPYPEEAPMSADAWTEPDLSALYTPTRGVAPGGFYGSRPAAPVVQEAAPRPNAFYPSGGVGLVDLGIPRRQR